MYFHKINTTLGTFHFRWNGDYKTDLIIGRFDDPSKAKKVYVLLNEFGAYHFKSNGQFTALDELMNFLEDLRQSNRLIKFSPLMLLKQFKKKYGQPISTTFWANHITFNFPKDRWVAIDHTGEMSWDGKKNQYNLKAS